MVWHQVKAEVAKKEPRTKDQLMASIQEVWKTQITPVIYMAVITVLSWASIGLFSSVYTVKRIMHSNAHNLAQSFNRSISVNHSVCEV
jgi:hypothetical protein